MLTNSRNAALCITNKNETAALRGKTAIRVIDLCSSLN